MKKENIIQVSKNGALSLFETINAFQQADNLDKIKIAVENCAERVYASWASVDAVDRAGENIPIADIIAQQDILLRRGGPITDNHTNAVVGRTHAYKVLEHPVTGKMGVVHLNQIYSDNLLDDKVWGETLTGERTGSSVGGFTDEEKTKELVDGRLTDVLNGFHQYETASVYKPCNPHALNIAVSQVAKSDGSKQFLFVNKDGEVLKVSVENLGKAVQNSAESYNPKLKYSETSKNDTTIAGGSMTEQDILKSAIEKMDAGTPLNDAEKAALKGKLKAEDEKPEDKPEDDKEEKKKADGMPTGSDAPESPEPEPANEQDVVKQLLAAQKAQSEQIAQLTKLMAQQTVSKGVDVKKVETQKPFSQNSHFGHVSKAEELANVAKDIAMGKKKMTWKQATKMYHDVRKSMYA